MPVIIVYEEVTVSIVTWEKYGAKFLAFAQCSCILAVMGCYSP